ncbi:hypothetical protein JYU34_000227 [Plutella xylostella]|uniref:Uncharacterized protein n=1 Tax=Plutella xylostella TaxID=51655 RepID=A0ABQ7R7C4_PLUXY|nr:hypothetical protein JYU34_000227 [Plutella xylostella]
MYYLINCLKNSNAAASGMRPLTLVARCCLRQYYTNIHPTGRYATRRTLAPAPAAATWGQPPRDPHGDCFQVCPPDGNCQDSSYYPSFIFEYKCATVGPRGIRGRGYRRYDCGRATSCD